MKTMACLVMAMALVGGPAQASPTVQEDGCITHRVPDGSLMGKTCYLPAGNDQEVIDYLDNAWNVRVKVETDYGKVRYCAPWTVEVDGEWATCYYDHREDSCLHFRLYEQLGSDSTRTRYWSPWSRWLKVSTGGDCILP